MKSSHSTDPRHCRHRCRHRPPQLPLSPPRCCCPVAASSPPPCRPPPRRQPPSIAIVASSSPPPRCPSRPPTPPPCNFNIALVYCSIKKQNSCHKRPTSSRSSYTLSLGGGPARMIASSWRHQPPPPTHKPLPNMLANGVCMACPGILCEISRANGGVTHFRAIF
jgi:hypothetical protein